MLNRLIVAVCLSAAAVPFAYAQQAAEAVGRGEAIQKVDSSKTGSKSESLATVKRSPAPDRTEKTRAEVRQELIAARASGSLLETQQAYAGWVPVR